MRYLQKYQEFGKINEADGIDANKLQIVVQFAGYKVGGNYKKEIAATCVFNYDGKPLNTAPMNVTFLDSEDRFVYSITQSLKISDTASLTGPVKFGVLKSAIDASGKATIANYGAEQNTWALNLNKKGTAWMSQAVVVGVGGTPIKVEPIELNLGNYFAPNVDTIDETKKGELNAKLVDFEKYFNKGKDALRAPGATDKYTFTIVGGASQVATTYQGGNQALAQARANNLKKYIVEYYKTSNPDLSRFVSLVSTVSTVMGTTPYVQGKDNPQDPKFLAEQFVKMSVIVKI